MTVVKLDAGEFMAYYTKRVIIGMNKALLVLLEELKRNTPEDEGEMLNSYEVTQAREIGDMVRGEITNKAGHAIYVERGVNGLVFNYHKPKGKTFYSGVGNRTFARSVDNVRNKVQEVILAEVSR